MQIAPTNKKERIATLDILRGFSLFGILLVNILSFNYPINYVELRTYFTAPFDLQGEKWIMILVQGSFYPLFAWLFGYGLQMQATKAHAMGESFLALGSKRMSILLLFGLFHAFFIWYGDILTTYAIFGFILILMLKLKPRVQFIIGMCIYSVFALFMLLTMWVTEKMSDQYELSSYSDITNVKSSIEAYGSGSWLDAMGQRLIDVSSQFSFTMWMMMFFTVFPFMLVGAAMSQWKVIEKSKEKAIVWTIVAVIAIPLGIYLKGQMYGNNFEFFGQGLNIAVGAPLLMIGYTSAIIALCSLPGVMKLLTPLSYAGRMSLTLYIMQSIIQSILFYGFAIGLYGKLGVINLIYISIAIYVFQLGFARIYLSYFKQGPLETLWKKVTYSK
ncbi:DUF418 domain-containing protein [Kurthia zopfii]|uniref:DUF418 domain-containing protein n=1 Tax=Kurthia zopfii TaxID=1650 RepID=UPI000F6D25C5|nr:DUF418 domain-containing protein [Kurthia zopfii]VEI04952.1 Predicted membrane protein [Kurthia zopfii]